MLIWANLPIPFVELYLVDVPDISDMKACGESEEKRNHASDGSVITGKKKNANLNNAGPQQAGIAMNMAGNGMPGWPAGPGGPMQPGQPQPGQSGSSVITGKKKNANLNNAGRWKLVRPPTS
jgi:hypothetical protein